jgi:hypothetical protein
MNDPPPISFKTDTNSIIALLSKGFRATSALRFAPVRSNASKDAPVRSNASSSFDFPELLVVHNRSEWWGSVDCVILKTYDMSSSFDFPELLVVHNRSEWWGSVDCVILKTYDINIQILQKSSNRFGIKLKPGLSSKAALNRLKTGFLKEKPSTNEPKPGLLKVWTNVVNRVCEDLKLEINRP